VEPSITDETIALQLKANDQSAFQVVFQQHYTNACKTIRRFIRENSIVEDLAQDVFVRFWERRDKIEIKTSIGAYIHRMAINEALTFLRKQKKFQQDNIEDFSFSADGASSVEVMEGEELQIKIKHAIDSLPPKCRTVFLLSRHEEMSYKEIAAKLDISIKTVENQMGKALRVMREHLKDHLPGYWLLAVLLFKHMIN
jgi:RNA polymerase sigma-70 factor (ECF subfamily)